MSNELTPELRKEFAIALNALANCYEENYGSLSKNVALRNFIWTTALRLHVEDDDDGDFNLFDDNHENGLDYNWLLNMILKDIEASHAIRTKRIPKPESYKAALS